MSTFKIVNVTYEFTELKDEETQKFLKIAKEITCDCNYFNKRRLVVFQRGDTYYLRSYPKDGINHDPSCRFYNTGGDSNGAYSAFRYDDEKGTIDVKLDVFFQQKSAATQAKTSSAAYSKSSSKPRNSTSLLGLLKKVWYESSLYIYRKDKNYDNPFKGVIYRNLMHLTSARREAKKFICAVNPDWQMNINSLIKEIDVSYPIVIGILDDFVLNHEDKKYYLKLKGYKGNIKISYDDYEKYVKFCNNKAAWQTKNIGSHSPMDIIICQCEIITIKRTGIRFLNLLEGTSIQSMAVTDKYIPYDSFYEKQMADYLVDNKRSFRKPMYIFDNTGMMPDFILTDTMEKEVCLEIWGMTGNNAYEARKKEKIKLYEQQNIKLIQWEPLKNKELPVIPKRVSEIQIYTNGKSIYDGAEKNIDQSDNLDKKSSTAF